MNTRYKRFLTLTMALMSAIVTLAHDVEVNGIFYNLNHKTKEASVTFNGNKNKTKGYENNITIPTNITIDNELYKVTSIGEEAFMFSSFKSITIPNSISSIGEDAFYNCKALTSVNIPNSVSRIEAKTFYNCRSLKEIIIPNSVTTICEWSFSCCDSLASITIPSSVTSIEKRAFYECSNLTSITIPNSVTSIGESTFGNCI